MENQAVFKMVLCGDGGTVRPLLSQPDIQVECIADAGLFAQGMQFSCLRISLLIPWLLAAQAKSVCSSIPIVSSVTDILARRLLSNAT